MKTYSVKITGAQKLIVQSDESEMLAVDFDVLCSVDGADPTVEAHYSHGFPLATTQADVYAYFQDYVANYTANAQRAEENAVRDEQLAVADATIAAIVGADITN